MNARYAEGELGQPVNGPVFHDHVHHDAAVRHRLKHPRANARLIGKIKIMLALAHQLIQTFPVSPALTP